MTGLAAHVEVARTEKDGVSMIGADGSGTPSVDGWIGSTNANTIAVPTAQRILKMTVHPSTLNNLQSRLGLQRAERVVVWKKEHGRARRHQGPRTSLSLPSRPMIESTRKWRAPVPRGREGRRRMGRNLPQPTNGKSKGWSVFELDFVSVLG
jgi:hypothetical protein